MRLVSLLVMFWFCVGSAFVLYPYCIRIVLVVSLKRIWYCKGIALVLHPCRIRILFACYWSCLSIVSGWIEYCICIVLASYLVLSSCCNRIVFSMVSHLIRFVVLFWYCFRCVSELNWSWSNVVFVLSHWIRVVFIWYSVCFITVFVLHRYCVRLSYWSHWFCSCFGIVWYSSCISNALEP